MYFIDRFSMNRGNPPQVKRPAGYPNRGDGVRKNDQGSFGIHISLPNVTINQLLTNFSATFDNGKPVKPPEWAKDCPKNTKGNINITIEMKLFHMGKPSKITFNNADDGMLPGVPSDRDPHAPFYPETAHKPHSPKPPSFWNNKDNTIGSGFSQTFIIKRDGCNGRGSGLYMEPWLLPGPNRDGR
jgi:hypothetical protein